MPFPPPTSRTVEADDLYGPALQMAMFTHSQAPDASEVEEFAERARERFAALDGEPEPAAVEGSEAEE